MLPKPLMPLGDGPILDVLLRQLAVQGWREVTLAVGHMANLIRAYCGNGSRYGLKLATSRRRSPSGRSARWRSCPRPRASAPCS